jgi:hypothetical protein
MDSCDYLHRVVAATEGVALTLEAAGAGSVATASPPPTDNPNFPPPAQPDGPPKALLVGAVLVLVIGVGAGFLLFRQGRRA